MPMEEEAEVAAMRRRRRPTPDHPPYSEMVQCAIRALAEKHGSTEAAISVYIRSHYDSLPWAHSKLLPYYLHKLLLAGEISKSSSSPSRYILPKPPNPNPNPSPQPDGSGPRKRGRPKSPFPKPLPPRPLVKRGRGRPRMIKFPDSDPNSSRPVFAKPTSMPKLGSGEQRPSLILKLKRSRSAVAGGHWHCLREQVREKDSNGVDVDGHSEESNGEKIEEHDENLLASQEEDDHHVESREPREQEDFEGIKTDEHTGELPTVKGNELAGIEAEGHKEELSGLQAVPDASPCEQRSDRGTPCKKARPKKTRKLWYEG